MATYDIVIKDGMLFDGTRNPRVRADVAVRDGRVAEIGRIAGLDVLLVYIAFKVSYRSAAAYEQVTMTPSTLTVRKVTHRGRVAVELRHRANLADRSETTKAHAARAMIHTFLRERDRAVGV